MITLQLAPKERPLWFLTEAATAHMDMKKPSIKWSKIRSLSIEGLTVRVMYAGRKQITYCFDTEAEMLEVLDDRSEVDGGLSDQRHVFFREKASRQQRAGR